MPITHRKSNRTTILELSLNNPQINNKLLTDLKLADFKQGDEVLAFVNNITNGMVWVSISPTIKGRIPMLDLTEDGSIFQDIDNKLPIGNAINVKVKQVDLQHQILVLTARKILLKNSKMLDKIKHIQQELLKSNQIMY